MSDELPHRIVIVTDAWLPQVNGVVTTLRTTVETLEQMGHVVLVIEPSLFNTFPCPTYPEIRLAWFPGRRIEQLLRDFAPHAIHIATEGTLGHAARSWCLRQRLPFTSAYHTQFPEYLAARLPIPHALSYAWLRRFHGAASRTMVATQSMQQQLQSKGFKNLAHWSRGVDTELFKPRDQVFLSFAPPIWLYVGRIAVEKNIEAFLQLDLPGTKVLVGDGPARQSLSKYYPAAQFVGYRFGEALASHVATADVFVFPSRSDTFGLVLLEAMACGVPIAAYPVTGPIDVVTNGVSGILHEDLATAARAALLLNPEDCRRHALRYSWQSATQQFLKNLQPFTAQLPSVNQAEIRDSHVRNN